MLPSVGGAAASRHQALVLQRVHEDDDPARGSAEPGGELPLADAGAARQRPERSGLGRRQVEPGDRVGEALSSQLSHLGQPESSTARRGCTRHVIIIVT